MIGATINDALTVIVIIIVSVLVFVITITVRSIRRGNNSFYAGMRNSDPFSANLNKRGKVRRRVQSYTRRRTAVGIAADLNELRRQDENERDIVSYHNRRIKKRWVRTARRGGRRSPAAMEKIQGVNNDMQREIGLLRKMLAPVNQKQIDKAIADKKKDPKIKVPKPRYHAGAGRVNGSTGETHHGIGREGHRTRGHSFIIGNDNKKK